MTTKKLHIKHLDNTSFVDGKVERYSYAFRRLYKMLDESFDSTFVYKFKETFHMNDIEYRSLLSDVKSFRNREDELNAEKREKILELQDKLNDSKTSKRERFKALRKLPFLLKSISREPTFGGKTLQQRLTRECNRTERDELKIQSLKDEFRRRRKIPFQVIGEANRKGNRFFDISRIGEGVITYKPCRGTRIALTVSVPKNWKDDLVKLSKMCEGKVISVTVRLCSEYICLSYDEEVLNGYSVDDVSRRKDVSAIKMGGYPKDVEASLIKSKYKEYYDEQRDRKMVGKIEGRCIAVDMNPTNIGWSVLDKAENNSIRVVSCGIFDFGALCRKSGKASSHMDSKHIVNKRKYEITVMVKKLFMIARHYRCSSFVMEDLEVNDNLNREANRLVRSVWNRGLFAGCVARRCSESGITLVSVNPCYTSFIGNIQHPYADSCNASIEIGRRGLWRYANGGFYPDITEEDMRTLEAKFGDVVACGTGCGWVGIYKSLRGSLDEREFSRRLRAGVCEAESPHVSFSMDSYRSGIKVILFI